MIDLTKQNETGIRGKRGEEEQEFALLDIVCERVKQDMNSWYIHDS